MLVLNLSNLAKFEFGALDITRKTYLSWMLDVEICLGAMSLGDVIKEINKASKQLFFSYNNNILKKEFYKYFELFHAFSRLNKTMSSYEKS